ncbi:MAG TPA: aldose epimerase family protein [Saprospiraceae bacterium]|nr:aldose epimerase family protein [Saprospiraceae bacterium]
MKDLHAFTLRNSIGMEAGVINFGATVTSIKVPLQNGESQEVTLGFDTAEEYVLKRSYMGPIAGRVANRIAKGRFTLDGKAYQLDCNNGPNHLHGGPNGWAKVFWEVVGAASNSVQLKYHSPDGDEGYPGNVDVRVTYTIEESNALSIVIEASTDAPTLINPTSHCYFNLYRDHLRIILDHDLQIHADHYTPSDVELIPTGEIASVIGTPMNFLSMKKVGEDIHADFDQLRNANGYDHNWVLNDYTGQLIECARLHCASSGLTMITSTNQPGIQCYSGNSLHHNTGRQGQQYDAYSGICLETQGFPDAVNHPNFPSVIVRPRGRYYHLTQYRFLYL